MIAGVVLSAMERAIDPPSAEEQARLDALDAHLARTFPPGRGADLEARGEFPDEALRAFAAEGFAREIVPEQEGGCLDWSRAMRVGMRLAAHDVDLALCLGGAVLGGMPLLVAGNGAQRAQYFSALLNGEMGALALSEWEHGSDLLAIDARAEPLDAKGAPCAAKDAVGFRLFGTKSPANNGSRGANVVVLARTGAVGDPFGASLFLVARATPGVKSVPRFDSVGFRSMDLSGVALDGAEVPRGMLIGNAGEGFTYARRSLEVSRSGVASMSVGAHAQCLAMALAHARSRVLYGKPIGALEGVQSILGRVYARFAEAVALARRASRSAARWPGSARAWTAAAKLVCPRLLEESVHDVGTLLGARSLVGPQDFARLRRTAPVFAIFDGSSQLQLDELWRHAGQWPTDATLAAAAALTLGRSLRDPRHVPFDASREDTTGELDRATPGALLRALDETLPGVGLGTLADVAGVVALAARDGRSFGQALRFRISEATASLFAIASLAEATALAEGATRAAVEAALARRVSTVAPALAATLVGLEPKVSGAAEQGARALLLARDDEARCAAAHAAALRLA
jgi:alkylation response protein AidB-like acyl-CoA dehydrogenase